MVGAFLHRITSLGGGSLLRRKAVTRELLALPLASAFELLDGLVSSARAGAPDAKAVLGTVVAAFALEESLALFVSDVAALAESQAADGVKALLTEVPPQ